jgi:hypothetical protein
MIQRLHMLLNRLRTSKDLIAGVTLVLPVVIFVHMLSTIVIGPESPGAAMTFELVPVVQGIHVLLARILAAEVARASLTFIVPWHGVLVLGKKKIALW